MCLRETDGLLDTFYGALISWLNCPVGGRWLLTYYGQILSSAICAMAVFFLSSSFSSVLPPTTIDMHHLGKMDSEESLF
jgi:hypothetical protein